VERRRFLSLAAGGALAAVAAPGLLGSTARPAEGRWQMRLSCSSINYTKLPIEEACQRIAALGFEAIDVWSAHAGCPHLDDVLKRLGPDGLKEVLAKNKLKLYAFSVYQGGYRKYAELLGKAGGGVAVRGSAGPCDPKELTARMKAFFEALKPEIELAEKHNSYLAIENHGGALLSSLDSFKAFVDVNRHTRVGIALAPYHLQGLKASVEEAIATSGKQLFFFYAWQNAGGLGQLPGHGPTDFVPWIAALAKAAYAWYVNPFLHNEPEPEAMTAALAKSRDYLKQCYAKAPDGR
jgi:sugar phosphate isomerase/epimerase